KRRHAELHNEPVEAAPARAPETTRGALAQTGAARTAMARASERRQQMEGLHADDLDAPGAARRAPQSRVEPTLAPQRPSYANAPVLHDEFVEEASAPQSASAAQRADMVSRNNHLDMVNELRSMKGLIEERFGALAFMEKLQRQPRQALLAQKLLDVGFSPALIRKMVDALPAGVAD